MTLNDYFIGQDVVTPYGEANVKEIREYDLVCHPKKWQLDGGSIPVFYLNPACVEAFGPPPKEILHYSKGRKAEGVAHHKKGDFEKAQIQYMMAIEALEKLPLSIGNEVRAEKYEINVTCKNNIAICAFKRNRGKECFRVAQEAFKLVHAIEAKANPGPSKMFDELCKIGTVTSLDEIRKLWKRKSVYYMGQACFLNKEYDKALEYYKEALALLDSDENFAKEANAIEKRMQETKREKTRFAKKEKSKYQKAFGKDDDTNSTTPGGSPMSSPAKSPQVPMAPTSTVQKVIKTDGATLPTPAELKASGAVAKSTEQERTNDVGGGNEYDDDSDYDDDDEDDSEEPELSTGPWPAVAGVAVVGLLAFVFLRGRR